jgi:hypothetical protein
MGCEQLLSKRIAVLLKAILLTHPPKIEFMSFNSGDEPQQNIQDRLDRILRAPDTRPAKSPEIKPPVIPALEDSSSSITQVPGKKKSQSSSFSKQLKGASESLVKLSKSIRGGFLSLSKRLRVPKIRTRSGAIRNTSPKARKFTPTRLTKPVAFVVSGVSVIVVLSLTVILNFAYLTVGSGIETTLGSSEDRTVLVLKASDAQGGDLLVASLSVDEDTNQEILVMGTVFSKNDQTYALYDGDVIWQITADQIRGIVLFAEATESP